MGKELAGLWREAWRVQGAAGLVCRASFELELLAINRQSIITGGLAGAG